MSERAGREVGIEIACVDETVMIWYEKLCQRGRRGTRRNAESQSPISHVCSAAYVANPSQTDLNI